METKRLGRGQFSRLEPSFQTPTRRLGPGFAQTQKSRGLADWAPVRLGSLSAPGRCVRGPFHHLQ